MAEKPDRRPGRLLREIGPALERAGRAAREGVREALRDRTSGATIGRDVGAYAARGGRVPQEPGNNISVRGTTLSDRDRAFERRRAEQGYKNGGVVKKPTAKRKPSKRQRP